jgi:HEAT repeat protein
MSLLLNLRYTWCRAWQRVASEVSAFQAWERLLRSGEPRALAPLVRSYARSRLVTGYVIDNYTFKRLGPTIAPLLTTLLADPDRDTRIGAASALADLAPRLAECDAEDLVPPLLAALARPDETLRFYCARALAPLRDPRVPDALWAAFQETTEVYPWWSIREALVAQGERRVIPALVAALEADSDHRAANLRLLEALDWQPADAQERMLAARTRRDWEGLAAEGPVAVPLVVDLAICYDGPAWVYYDGPGYEDPRDWNSDSLQRQRLSDALIQFGPAAAEALVAAAEQHRGWGIRVLERMVAHTGEDWPTALLVRALAAGAVEATPRLLSTRGAEAVPALLTLLSAPQDPPHQSYSKDMNVVKAAAQVLASIGDPRALEALEAYLTRDRYNRSVSEAIQRMRSSSGQP